MRVIINIIILLVIVANSYIAPVNNSIYEPERPSISSVDTPKILVEEQKIDNAMKEHLDLIRENFVYVDSKLSISETIPVPIREFCKDYDVTDHNPLTGFIDDWGYCVPGLVTTDVWFTKSPEYVYGTAVVYAPWQMEGTARWRRMYDEAYGYDTDYLGGVATPSPADIGETVWLRQEGGTWEGPYLVVDCSRRADMYTHIAINQQVVEVDFNTAVRWGMANYTKNSYEIHEHIKYPIEVHYGKEKPKEDIRNYEKPIYFNEYWLSNVVEFQRDEIELQPWLIEFGINPVWDLRDGNGEQCFTRDCNN